jgi:hypothetical protein
VHTVELLSKHKSEPPSLVILIRHAEKPGESKGHAITDDETTDPNLSPLGYYRAGAYAAYFDAEKNGGLYPPVDYIFATAASHKSNRPVLTVTQLAAALGKKIHHNYGNDQSGIDALAADVLSGAYAGQTVLICWHHGTMPAVAAALGYDDAPKVPGTSFDVVWQLEWKSGSAAPSFTPSTENLMYDDAASLQTLDVAATMAATPQR